MAKPRVMFIVKEYPQVTQTYVKNEIEHLMDDYDIEVIGMHKAVLPYKSKVNFQITNSKEKMIKIIKKFNPDVLHGHWFFLTKLLSSLSKETNVPFTIRGHSFDCVKTPPRYHMPGKMVDILRCAKRRRFDLLYSVLRYNAPFHLIETASLLNEERCLGVLAFPFTRPLLEAAGIASDKIHDCWPVVDYKRFYDASKNGKDVMNVGACHPKKKMENFIQLGARFQDKNFNLYAVAYIKEKIRAFNKKMGDPVNMVGVIQPENMPKEYKKHEWFVYTSCPKLATVGWPSTIAEAQASGCGVCMPNLRPDLKDYIGEAGFVYDSMEEVDEIISKPFPEEMRKKGFEQAKKSDIAQHKALLTKLWDKAM